jgi:hypothetical protein
MTLVALPGAPLVDIGPGYGSTLSLPSATNIGTMDAVNEATLFIGHVLTSDGGSHTIDTSGSSSLGWRTSTVTFASGSTTVKVGLATVLTTAGPPARAVNVSDVITFDVSKSLTGGAGGITANAWQTHVPDTGSKIIANGDLIAFCVQMTARGGTDSVIIQTNNAAASWQRPVVTTFASSVYGVQTAVPNAIITFSDGAIGYFQASDVFSTINLRTWNSSSSPKEYGQLIKLPFPVKVYGLYAWIAPTADCDMVLYSNPLGTPVAERTVALDANAVATASGRVCAVHFSSAYDTSINQDIVVAFKPGASNVTAYYRTIASASHRVADPYGVNGYGVSRTSGAFADASSSLDHYYIGLIAGGFDSGGGGRAIQVNDNSLVA